MKNKLLIMVLASCSLIAMGSISWAWEGPTISGPITFGLETLLESSQMATCGDGVFGVNVAGEPEQCEFDTAGNPLTVSPSGAPVATCPVDFTCNPQTCLCDPPPPICGDGIFAGKFEQCEAQLAGTEVTPENIDKMCVRVSPLTLLIPSWFTPPPLAEGAHYVCRDCMCETCGNGVVDPGEQCEQDSDCQGISKCTIDCTCVEETTVTDEPQTQCTVKVYGFSNDASEKMVQSLNVRVHEILGTNSIDIFGEEIYSRFVAQIRFYDSAVLKDTLPSMLKLIKGVGTEVDMTSTAIIKYHGGYETSLSEMTFRPMPDENIMAPVLIFPRGSATNVTMGKSLAGKDIQFITPDLSAAGIAFETDLSSWGAINMTVVDESESSMNDTIRYKVVPHIPSKPGEVAPKEVLVEALFRPAPASWLGGGEQNPMDPEEVLVSLKTAVDEWKAAGREIDFCDITAQLKVAYAPTMRSTFLVASDTIDIKTGGAGPLQTKAFGIFAVRTEGGYGGRATSTCSLTGAQVHVPQILLSIGMWLASLAGIGIIRRKKR